MCSNTFEAIDTKVNMAGFESFNRFKRLSILMFYTPGRRVLICESSVLRSAGFGVFGFCGLGRTAISTFRIALWSVDLDLDLRAASWLVSVVANTFH